MGPYQSQILWLMSTESKHSPLRKHVERLLSQHAQGILKKLCFSTKGKEFSLCLSGCFKYFILPVFRISVSQKKPSLGAQPFKGMAFFNPIDFSGPWRHLTLHRLSPILWKGYPVHAHLLQLPGDLIPFALADKGKVGKLTIKTRRFLIKKLLSHGLSYQRMGSPILQRMCNHSTLFSLK